MGFTGIRVGKGNVGGTFKNLSFNGLDEAIVDEGASGSWNQIDIKDCLTGIIANGRDNTYDNISFTTRLADVVKYVDRDKFITASKNIDVAPELQLEIFDDLKGAKPFESIIDRIQSHVAYKTADAVGVLATVIQLIMLVGGS